MFLAPSCNTWQANGWLTLVGTVLTLDVVDWLNVVGGIISIGAFVASVWVWLRADGRTKELRAVIANVHKVCSSIIWQMQTFPAENVSSRLAQAEKSLGAITAIREITSSYVDTQTASIQTDISELFVRGIIMTPSMIYDIEQSRDTAEVWLLTPDLEPDTSDPQVGRIVRQNLRSGKNYVYFYPADLSGIEEKTSLLLKNIAGASTRLISRVTLVPIDRAAHTGLFHRGNSIIFFSDTSAQGGMHAFEEITLTSVPGRGVFWQGHAQTVAESLRRVLNERLIEWRRTR